MSEEASNAVDLSALGSFDFTPDWAKKDEKVTVGKFRPEKGGDERVSRDDRRPNGPKKPFGDRGRQAGPAAPRPRRDGAPFQRFERPKPLDCEIKILPETKSLGTIIRKLQSDVHAFKLKDLAYFFLDNPESILLKITPKGEERFCQCRACGFASTNADEVADHAVAVHLADYYDAKEIDCEPPKGNFTCVAKCGLSGVLLGPPNIHEFNAVVKEMIRTRYPDMTEDQYRSHIEMVRDADAIEEWRKGAVRKTVFFAKGQAEVEGAAQMTREQAEGEFRRTILPSLLDTPKHLMVTAAVAAKSPVKSLVWAVNDAIAAERRAPYSMCFALRGAFHHRKLKFFRANDAHGPEFVTNAELKAFDSEHAIPELASAAKFIADHPCCDRSEFPTDVPDFEKHLGWLVSTGHAVAFTNGVFSAVEKYPKYGPQWKKRHAAAKAEAPAAEKTESPAPKAEEPAAEAAAEAVKQEETAEVNKDETAAQLA